MDFSVLISVYANEKPSYLKESLTSLLDQSILPNEIVIIKDGPLSQELDNLIRDFVSGSQISCKVIALTVNKGLGFALNLGVTQCTYNIIARMDTDDIADYHRFEKQIEFMKCYPNFDLVGSYISEFSDNVLNLTSIRTVPCKMEDILRYARRRNPFNHMTVMFRKDAVLKAGNYQPFQWNEDYYLWVRMIKSGAVMGNIDESLVYVRAGKDMYRRRGGLDYIRFEYRLQKEMMHLGFIGRMTFLRNVLLRSLVRIFPNSWRSYLYYRFLRARVNHNK